MTTQSSSLHFSGLREGPQQKYPGLIPTERIQALRGSNPHPLGLQAPARLEAGEAGLL